MDTDKHGFKVRKYHEFIPIHRSEAELIMKQRLPEAISLGDENLRSPIWCSRPELNRDQSFRKLKYIRANDSKSGHTLAKSDTSFDTVFFNW
jgi:hypothetical protein